MPVISLKDLRFKLGVEDNEYPTMDNFKRRVLDPSIKQINKYTDITAGYDQHKAGRVITGFSFYFKQNKPKKTEKPAATQKQKPQNNQLDLLNNDTIKRFNGLSKEQQKAIIDGVEKALTGVKQARFKVAKTSKTDQLVAEFAVEINESMVRILGLGEFKQTAEK